MNTDLCFSVEICGNIRRMSGEVFIPFELRHGWLGETTGAHASQLFGWRNDVLSLEDEGTHFGYVLEATATLTVPQGVFVLTAGMYFAVPSRCTVGGAGSGIVITRVGHRGVFSIGGPIETEGRLRYIDGCTDSLLIQPQLKGDPCLNALYLPAGVSQTEHTHPSVRIGLIVQGTGECRTATARHSLSPGRVFIIRENGSHSFATIDDSMVVIAYHPDSDYGPTHEEHPMINRTIIV